MDYTVHRPSEPIYLAKLHVLAGQHQRSNRDHMRRPRSSKGWSYCGLRIKHAEARRMSFSHTVDLSSVCKNCIRSFYEETFLIYAHGEQEIPDGWIKLWKLGAGELEIVNNEPPIGGQTIIAMGLLLRNAAQVAQLHVELGTAELAPAEAFEAFVEIRDNLQVVIERLELAEETLQGFDVSTNRAASRLARQIRTILK